MEQEITNAFVEVSRLKDRLTLTEEEAKIVKRILKPESIYTKQEQFILNYFKVHSFVSFGKAAKDCGKSLACFKSLFYRLKRKMGFGEVKTVDFLKRIKEG